MPPTASATALLRAAIQDLHAAKRLQVERLPALADAAGVLDDAERDATSHQAGPLRDVALVGAIRKGKAAEIVSSETARALAHRIGDALLAAVVDANRREEIASDRAFRALLGELTR